MPWYPDRARQFLDNAAHERAAGPGMSDTTLERLAALTDPESSTTKAAFIRALTRAGWAKRRVAAAVRAVQAPIVDEREPFRARVVRAMRRSLNPLSVLGIGLGTYLLMDAFRPGVFFVVLLAWVVLLWPMRRAAKKPARSSRSPAPSQPARRIEEGGDNARYLRVVAETKRLIRGEDEVEVDEEREPGRRRR